MSQQRKQYSAAFKFQVALEAAKGTKTINQIASEHQLHPNQVSEWKRQLVGAGATLFRRASARQEREQSTREAELYEQIGRLQMEVEWLKKSSQRLSKANGR